MLKLLFGKLLAGEISTPHYTDETWYGVLRVDPSLVNEEVGQRILAFKDFSEDWNVRLSENQNSAPDASEFDEYLDLLESSEWRILNEDEGICYHVNCPVFFPGGDFSCRPWESSSPGN